MQIDDFLRHFNPVKKVRDGWMVRCPAHADHSPSLHVSAGDDRMLVKCFAGCAASEIVEALDLELADLFYEPRQHGSAPRFVRPEPVTSFAGIFSERAERFLKDRGITRETANAAGAFADEEALYFPMTRRGKLIDVKTRFIPKGFALETGAERIWYGLDWCEKAQTIVVCEGELDVLSLRQIGVESVLSPPHGSEVGRMEYFASAAPHFAHATRVVIATDADEPGRKFGDEVARRVGAEKCFRVAWPADCNDANDVLRVYGEHTLRTLIDTAPPMPVAGIIRPSDLRTAYLQLYRDGVQRGEKTGWLSLDRYYSLWPGSITVITGVPSSGKSEWLDAMLVEVCRRTEWTAALFSPENRPAVLHLARWAEKYLGLPFFPGRNMRMDEAASLDALDWADAHLAWIDPEEPTLDAILKMAEAEIMRRGCRIVTIDPWNEVIHNRRRDQGRDEYLSFQLRRLRRWAEQHGVMVFLVVHPHADIQVTKEGQFPVIGPYDLADGAMWMNKIDALISVWRDAQDATQPVQVHVMKTRTRLIGKRGKVNLEYEWATGRYQDLMQWEDKG